MRAVHLVRVLVAGLLVMGVVVQCTDDDDDGVNDSDRTGSITTFVANNDSLATLEAALMAADLDTVLAKGGPYTLFAPTDAAFNQLPAGTLDSLLASPQGNLTTILQYHVLAEKLLASDLEDSTSVQTLEGTTISIDSTGDSLTLNGSAKVISADRQTPNGVVHLINQVLVPSGVTLP